MPSTGLHWQRDLTSHLQSQWSLDSLPTPGQLTGRPSSRYSAISLGCTTCGSLMARPAHLLKAMQMQMAAWPRITTPCLATLFSSMAVPFCGPQSDRKLFPCPPPRASTLWQCTVARRPCGFAASSLRYSAPSLPLPLYSLTIRQPSRSRTTTSTTCI